MIFDSEGVNDATVRITEKLAPHLRGENPAHVTATLVIMLASYLTMMSSEARVPIEDVDLMIDKIAKRIKRDTRIQRAHHHQMTNPGHA